MTKKIKSLGISKELLGDILLIITGVGLIIFTVLTTKSVMTLDRDKVPQTYALFVDAAHALHNNNELSLWLPYLWGGGPNIGNFITEAFYPINWILCNLFYDPNTGLVSYAIIPWNSIIHYSIYFIGLYCLIKRIGFSKLNAFATSIMSTLSSALFMYREWTVSVNGFCYLPLIILFTVMLYEEKNKLLYSIILAVLFAVEASISMSIMLVMSVYLFGILFIAYIIGNNKKNIIRNLGFSALTGILAVLLVAPLFFSALTFAVNMVRNVPGAGFVKLGAKIPLEEFTKYRYTWNEFPQMVRFNNYNVGISLSAFVLVFCMIGFFCKKKHSKKLYYVSLVGVVICGLACFAIIFPAAFYYVPGINQLREPYMYGLFLNLFASIIAAWGFNGIEKKILERTKLKEHFHLIIVCAPLVLCLLGYNIRTQNETCVLLSILFIILIPIALVKQAWIRKFSLYICTFLIIGLGGKDLYCSINYFPYTELEAIEQVKATCENSRKLIEYVDSLDPSDEYYRMTKWGSVAVLPTNMASILGFYDIVGYLNPTFSSGIALHLNLSLAQRVQLQNIKYFLISAQEEQSFIDSFENNPEYTKVGEMDHVFADYTGTSEGTVYIYQALLNLGDAWLVSDYSWNESNTKEEVLVSVASNAIAVDKTAIINACTLTDMEQQDLRTIDPSAAKGTVVCKNVSNNSLVYDVSAQSSGILVTAELYYPGWKVYVNGKQRTILEIDGTNRGVIVPSGESTVEFRFLPVGFRVGIALQIFAIALIILAGIWRHRETNKRKGGHA